MVFWMFFAMITVHLLSSYYPLLKACVEEGKERC